MEIQLPAYFRIHHEICLAPMFMEPSRLHEWVRANIKNYPEVLYPLVIQKIKSENQPLNCAATRNCGACSARKFMELSRLQGWVSAKIKNRTEVFGPPIIKKK